jgi:hypothetical protein
MIVKNENSAPPEKNLAHHFYGRFKKRFPYAGIGKASQVNRGQRDHLL